MFKNPCIIIVLPISSSFPLGQFIQCMWLMTKKQMRTILGLLIVSCPVLKLVESWSNFLSMVMETHILTYAGSHSFLLVVHETMLSLYSIICGNLERNKQFYSSIIHYSKHKLTFGCHRPRRLCHNRHSFIHHHHHHHQSLVPTMLGSAARIMFLHSNLS